MGGGKREKEGKRERKPIGMEGEGREREADRKGGRERERES